MSRINKTDQATQLNRDAPFRPIEFKLADGRAATVSSTQRGMLFP